MSQVPYVTLSFCRSYAVQLLNHFISGGNEIIHSPITRNVLVHTDSTFLLGKLHQVG